MTLAGAASGGAPGGSNQDLPETTFIPGLFDFGGRFPCPLVRKGQPALNDLS